MELLGPGDLHLKYSYAEEFKNSKSFESAFAILSQAEKSQYQKYSFEKDKNLYLLARYLLRSTLSRYSNAITPANWVFEFNPFGRPFVINKNRPNDLFFNLSHSDGIVVCALASTQEVGVDVENSKRESSYLELAEHCFSNIEIEKLKSMDKKFHQAEFFKFWTLKESYIKARGMGLQLPLDQFSFQIGKKNDVHIVFDPRMNEDSERWKFKLINSIGTYQIAVALATSRDLKVREEYVRF